MSEEIARLLMAEWERVEGPVSSSYVANFADMARAVEPAIKAKALQDAALEAENSLRPYASRDSFVHWLRVRARTENSNV